MTQTSYFWDGITTGDASLAPYDYAEYADFMESIAGNFVVPGYLFGGYAAGYELDVREDLVNLGEVTVYPGVALVHGVLYILNESVNVSIPATAGANPAIYRIVLDKDTATQTVRASLLQGVPAVSPEPPAVAANEMTLAWIYVDGAYNPASDVMEDEFIHDERVFRYIGPETDRHIFKNLLPNGQFMAYSGGADTAPDGWNLVGAPTINYITGGRVCRGWAASLEGGAGTGFETTVPINVDAEIFTLRGYVEVDADSFDVEIFGQILDSASSVRMTKTFPIMISPLSTNEGITEFVMRLNVDPAYDALRIRFTSNGAGTIAIIGDLALIPGYVAGTKETVRKSELIMFNNAVADVNWTASAKSTSNVGITLSSIFGSFCNGGARGAIFRVRCRDSGSAAAAVADGTSVSLQGYNSASGGSYALSGTVSCTGLPNDKWASGIIYIALDPQSSTPAIIAVCKASGAGTLDVTIEMIGLIT